MRIVFMGTPEFSVPSLRRLREKGHELVLVVTQPDRPRGRGRRVCAPPVKCAALEFGLPIDQVDSVNCDEFVERLQALRPDVLVVVAFGQILCEAILEVPQLGAINLHGSLLPRYRGVAPINWAIVRGEAETGVTTMFMRRKVDAGEIILSRTTPIGENETAGELYARLANIGADVLVETLDLVAGGEAPRIGQDPAQATYARKLTRADGEIDWSKPATEVHDHIRGMTPWPGAYTYYRGRMLEVLSARRGALSVSASAPGQILAVDRENGIEVATGAGSVRLLEVKPEGRPAMSAWAFAAGYKPEPGTMPFEKPASGPEGNRGTR
jgi:methionyl-tRNA formyltransferase